MPTYGVGGEEGDFYGRMARHLGFKASGPWEKSHRPAIGDFQEHGETPLEQTDAANVSADGVREDVGPLCYPDSGDGCQTLYWYPHLPGIDGFRLYRVLDQRVSLSPAVSRR